MCEKVGENNEVTISAMPWCLKFLFFHEAALRHYHVRRGRNHSSSYRQMLFMFKILFSPA